MEYYYTVLKDQEPMIEGEKTIEPVKKDD